MQKRLKVTPSYEFILFDKERNELMTKVTSVITKTVDDSGVKLESSLKAVNLLLASEKKKKLSLQDSMLTNFLDRLAKETRFWTCIDTTAPILYSFAKILSVQCEGNGYTITIEDGEEEIEDGNFYFTFSNFKNRDILQRLADAFQDIKLLKFPINHGCKLKYLKKHIIERMQNSFSNEIDLVSEQRIEKSINEFIQSNLYHALTPQNTDDIGIKLQKLYNKETEEFNEKIVSNISNVIESMYFRNAHTLMSAGGSFNECFVILLLIPILLPLCLISLIMGKDSALHNWLDSCLATIQQKKARNMYQVVTEVWNS